MGKGNRRDPAKEAYWREQFAAQQLSGLAINQFCREHGLSAERFRWWKRELLQRQEAEPGGALFAELRISDRADRAGESVGTISVPDDLPLVVALPNGQQLHLCDGTQAGCAAAGAPNRRTDAPIEVSLSGGRRLCVRPGFDAETLTRLLALLERRPC